MRMNSFGLFVLFTYSQYRYIHSFSIVSSFPWFSYSFLVLFNLDIASLDTTYLFSFLASVITIIYMNNNERLSYSV